MHEISLVQNLIEQLKNLAAANIAKHVLTVTMEIGPLSGVVVDSFRFGFETLITEEPVLQGARLIVETADAVCRCSACGQVIRTPIRPDQCPQCGDRLLLTEGGDDIILRQVEME